MVSRGTNESLSYTFCPGFGESNRSAKPFLDALSNLNFKIARTKPKVVIAHSFGYERASNINDVQLLVILNPIIGTGKRLYRSLVWSLFLEAVDVIINGYRVEAYVHAAVFIKNIALHPVDSIKTLIRYRRLNFTNRLNDFIKRNPQATVLVVESPEGNFYQEGFNQTSVAVSDQVKLEVVPEGEHNDYIYHPEKYAQIIKQYAQSIKSL